MTQNKNFQKMPNFCRTGSLSKKGFLYFWKSQTEWFFLKLNHVFEIWHFEKLLFSKPDFSRLSKQVSTKVSQSFCRHFLTVAAKKTYFNATFHKTASKNRIYFLRYIEIMILAIITWMYMHMMCPSIGLMTSLLEKMSFWPFLTNFNFYVKCKQTAVSQAVYIVNKFLIP